MKVCDFRCAEIFYERQQKGEQPKNKLREKLLCMANLEANALVNLGKQYNHPDWIEFGKKMYEENQKRAITVQKHDDSQMIQNQVAKVADEPRVRDQSKEDGKSAKAAESSAQKKAR